MEVTLIAAMADDRCIGRAGALPWRLPEDLRRFREATLGKPVVMGRKTYEGLPRRPLDGRLNIILSRHMGAPAGTLVANDMATALSAARGFGAKECMVIGGAEVYALAMPFASRMVITHVPGTVDGGDAHFPPFDPAGWDVVASAPGAGGVTYRTYQR